MPPASTVTRQRPARESANTFGLPTGDDARRVTRGVFREQQAQVLAFLADHTLTVPQSFPALLPDAATIAERLAPTLAGARERGASDLLATVDRPLTLWTPDPERPHRAALICAETVNATTAAFLADALASAVAAESVPLKTLVGRVVQRLITAVRGWFRRPDRPRLIATSEASRAYHDGQEEAAVGTDIVGWEWMVGSDPCPVCKLIRAEARYVPLGQPFAVVGDHPVYSIVRYPPVHPRCFCSRRPVIRAEAESWGVPRWRPTLIHPREKEGGVSVTLNSAAVSHARALAKAGKVDNGAWSFDGADGDRLLGDPADWAAYGKWFFGVDSSASEGAKARYKYPFGKAGKVYTAALRAIASRAAQQGLSAVSDAASSLLEQIEGKGKKALASDLDYLCCAGGAVKALDDGTVEGQLVVFSSAADPDLHREFFTKATDFWEPSAVQVLYHHGLDPKLRKRRIGKAVLTVNDAGVWAKAQLERRDAYEEKIYEMAKAGKLGWSSGTAPHLVETKAIGGAKQILTWPIFEASLTPTPVEPRSVVSVKSLLWSAKGEMLGDIDEPVTLAALCRLNDMLCGTVYRLVYDESLEGSALTDKVSAALDEYKAGALAIVGGLMGHKDLVADPLEGDDTEGDDAADAAKGFRLSELTSWLADTRSAIKAGRTVSSSTRKRLLAIHQHMGAAHGDLQAFLNETDPDAGGPPAKTVTTKSAAKALDPLVLAKAKLSLYL